MDTRTCYNCIYSYRDPRWALSVFATGFSVRPACANHPDSLGRMRPTLSGPVCRNYRPKPATPAGDVRQIPLGDGFYAYVDAADYEWLSQYRWHLYSGGYAARCEKGKRIFMHREIMKPPQGMIVDHKNRSKLDNTRENLRAGTPAQNQRNRAKRPGAVSPYKGVGYKKDMDKYYARFRLNGRRFWLGLFDQEIEAARAYDYKAVECSGEFAWLNLPDEWPPERRKQVHEQWQQLNGESQGKKPEGKRKKAKEKSERAKGKDKKPRAGTRRRRGK